MSRFFRKKTFIRCVSMGTVLFCTVLCATERQEREDSAVAKSAKEGNKSKVISREEFDRLFNAHALPPESPLREQDSSHGRPYWINATGGLVSIEYR